MMKRDEVVAWLESRGFKLDAYGNYKKRRPDGRMYRFKLNRLTLHMERLVGHENDRPVWYRAASGYYKHLTIIEDGRALLMRKDPDQCGTAR